ncbi:MAG TPA: SdrD B-like domain-containing protein, partial [Methanothrix sp.]|nr:SdrD B-like domain-containing protein [Methanothrix sp.]
TSISPDLNTGNNGASCSNAIKSLSLSGQLWKDANGDGQQGAAAAEPGLSGWTVELKDKDTGQMASTESDPDGSYRFQGVVPGDYILSEVLWDNWVQTAPASKIYEVHVTDFNIESKDFGNRNLVEALQAALVVDPPVTTPGSTVTFTAAIGNIGETVVNTVRVTLTLPAGINFISASPKQDIVAKNSNGTTTLIWNSLPLAAVSTGADTVGSSGPNLPMQSGSITVTTNADPIFLGTANVNLLVEGTSSAAEVKAITTVGTIEVATPEPHIIKTADSNQVLPGGTVCYSITYWNPGEANLTGVEVADKYPAGTTFIYSTPEPDSVTENHWTIGELPAGAKGTITVCLKVPEKVNMTFSSQERAKGTGFVNTYRNMDTGFEPYSLTNVAVMSCAEANPVSSSATVEVADQAGTTLTQIESGSGSYSREGQTRIITSNKTIQVDSSLAANYAPTSFSLPKGRLMNFTSRWSEADLAMNERTGASLDERYLYANSIVKDSSIYLDENRSILATDSHFLGNGHIGTLKKSGPDDPPKAAPIFEGTEIYSGEFHLNETVREYGSNVISNKSASGSGFVSSDKSIRESQKTYEYGAGSYKSDEVIRTPESYVAKDLQATRAPANYSYSPGFGSFKSGQLSGSSLKWAEGVRSRSREPSNPSDKEGSLIREEISGADYIQAETVAGGLNDLNSRINYSGTGTFRAVLKDKVDLEEVYAGEYQIVRKIHLTGVSKYDRPHLSLMKTGNIIYNPITNITVASYTITVQNDGNEALGPVYVKDLFPVGTGYINSSVEPYQLETRLANWTFAYMSIGQTLSINLNLNVTEERDQMVNRVYALGYYDDHYVTASNFTVNEFAWLPCCEQKLRAYKIASIDPGDPRLIWYRIGIKNDMKCSMVARVIDILPDGLRFINSSIQPEPIADNLSWALANISAGKIAVIDYRVQAVNGGRFVNQAHIAVYAVDGSGSSVADVSAAINVGDLPSVRDSSGWSPPDWGLDQSEYICSGELDGSGWVSSAPVCISCSSYDA